LGPRANVDALGKERSLATIHEVHHSAVTDKNSRYKVIKQLLNNSFSVCPLHIKLRILNKGRPTPPLPIVVTQMKLRQSNIQDIFASLSMKCLKEEQDVKQRNFIVGLFFPPSPKCEVWNKKEIFLELNNLSSA